MIVAKGSVAGSPNGMLRWSVSVNSRLVQCHRIVYEIFNGAIPHGFEVDHIHGLDEGNKITNLRLVTHEINMQNCKMRVDNVSGVKGVFLREKKGYTSFISTWYDNGKKKSKEFSTNKYGYENALKLACEHRRLVIDYLCTLGAGYTERHIGEN